MSFETFNLPIQDVSLDKVDQLLGAQQDLLTFVNESASTASVNRLVSKESDINSSLSKIKRAVNTRLNFQDKLLSNPLNAITDNVTANLAAQAVQLQTLNAPVTA